MSAAEFAIFELTRTRAEVEFLSRQIGSALGTCHDLQMKSDDGSPIVEHLKDAYAMTSDQNEDGGSSDRYFVNHDGDVGAYLIATCWNCLTAHHAIQDRKLARKQYGIAKRRIALMGTNMMKEEK